MENIFELVMDAYVKRYQNVLKKYWPTMNDNGFTEHNQTVNFINAYESIATKNNEIVSSWYEFQISDGRKNSNHIDAILVNHTTKELYLIEAKRFSRNSIKKKRRELAQDYLRILSLDVKNRFENFFVDESIKNYQVYGVLLFDLWTETRTEKALQTKWENLCLNPNLDDFQDFLSSQDIDKQVVFCDSKCFLPMMKEVKADRLYMPTS